jgi:hypothetical protein
MSLMSIAVDPVTGLRDRTFRPYIDQEESTREIRMWDPFWTQGFYERGLYTYTKSCPRFDKYFKQAEREGKAPLVPNYGPQLCYTPYEFL